MSAQFDHERYSKSVPARLSSSYEEVLADARRLEADARRLELADELAVIVARNRELFSSLYSGESGGLCLRLRDLKRKMRRRAATETLTLQKSTLTPSSWLSSIEHPTWSAGRR